jgi:hypothetical protein
MDLLFRIFAFFLLFVSAQALAVADTAYLPADTLYKANITTPTQALGAPVGEWHVRHDQIAH